MAQAVPNFPPGLFDPNIPAHQQYALAEYVAGRLGGNGHPIPLFDANNAIQRDWLLTNSVAWLGGVVAYVPGGGGNPGGPAVNPRPDPALAIRLAANQQVNDGLIGRYVMRASDQLLQTDKDALADILADVATFNPNMTADQFYQQVLEINGWNTALGVAAGDIPEEPTMVAADVNTTTGTWAEDCVSFKDKQKMKEDPTFQLEPRKANRLAGAVAFLKIYPSRLMAQVEAVCKKSQFAPIDNIRLPPNVNFPDLIGQAVFKYDERMKRKCLQYNLDICIYRCRKRLSFWYHQGAAIPIGGQGTPFYVNVPGEAPFEEKKPVRSCINNIAIALNIMMHMGGTLEVDRETNAINGVLRDGTRIGPYGIIP